ncbi:CDP-alcohol phosphatidyltransferase family protein [Coralloluteibacterium thermophilus]|uniref:CDP-diacylglycerol--glycerol-3-phosphate 3-phosphatidyltransferase n=1 Tax=Coralloluteibacterium thermophilum TaxID=2707049 RepID=A0ABV9NHI1_9GAMM
MNTATVPGRWVPNAITLARMAATPAIVWLLATQAHMAALWLTLLAAASDALDGLLARRCGWRTRLGALLDPAADKLLVNALFVGLWLGGVLPGWLAALTFLRDLVLLVGAVAWRLRRGPLEIAPSALGKLATFAQLALVLGALAGLALDVEVAAPVAAGIWVVAALTVAAGLDYVVRWSRRARTGP